MRISLKAGSQVYAMLGKSWSYFYCFSPFIISDDCVTKNLALKALMKGAKDMFSEPEYCSEFCTASLKFVFDHKPTGRKAQPNPRARDFLSAVPVLIRYTHICVFCYLLRATIFGWIRVALGLALIPSEFHFLGFQSCVQASSIYCGNEVF